MLLPDHKIIAVDFDGTLCEEKWPMIGHPNRMMIHHIISEQRNGAYIILWTCRNGVMLDNAVTWCKSHNLIFDAVNENLPEIIELFGGVDTRKISADEYIDDKAALKPSNGLFRFLPYHHCSPKAEEHQDLQRCPNCGSELVVLRKGHNKYWYECDGDCWTSTDKFDTIEDAANGWNSLVKRVPEED